MKHKRRKKLRKYFRYFQLNHGISPPYKVVLDGQFFHAALIGKIHIRDQMPKCLLDNPCSLYTTKCVVESLRNQGRKMAGALSIAQQYQLMPCAGHTRFKDEAVCLTRLAFAYPASGDGESKRSPNGPSPGYVMCAQDPTVRSQLRKPGIPIMYIHGNTVVMEAPVQRQSTGSVLSQTEQKLLERVTGRPRPSTVTHPHKGVHNRRGLDTAAGAKPRRRGGPNPLSMRKKKKRGRDESEKPRRRKRVMVQPPSGPGGVASVSADVPKTDVPKTTADGKVGQENASTHAPSLPHTDTQLEGNGKETQTSALSSSTPAKKKRKRKRSRKRQTPQDVA